MMSSSQDTEQKSHYFLCGAVMFTSVKPGDAGNETREDFEKAPRCAECVSMCVCACKTTPVKKTYNCHLPK